MKGNDGSGAGSSGVDDYGAGESGASEHVT